VAVAETIILGGVDPGIIMLIHAMCDQR
jgi:hypothetical protein